MRKNAVQFAGYLGEVPDLAFTPKGKAVCTLSIACTDKWTDKTTGEVKETTTWMRAVCWGKTAEAAARMFPPWAKGKAPNVLVEGKLTTRTWKPEWSQKEITAVEIQVGTLTPIDREATTRGWTTGPGRTEEPPAAGSGPGDDEIPF